MYLQALSTMCQIVAEALVDTKESSFDVREFVIDKIVPGHGLQQFEMVLEKTTRIDLPPQPQEYPLLAPNLHSLRGSSFGGASRSVPARISVEKSRLIPY
jgi:hypothetical protein